MEEERQIVTRTWTFAKTNRLVVGEWIVSRYIEDVNQHPGAFDVAEKLMP